LTRLLIIGGGGHGAVVAEAAAETGLWSEILFLDDVAAEEPVLDYRIAGPLTALEDFLDERTKAVAAIGDNRRRLELTERIAEYGDAVATVIHPTACISRSSTISAGTVVFAGAIVNARASLGPGCVLNTGATVDHDCVLGAGVHVSPGANLAGGVTVGDCAWVGIGAAVKGGICIGADAVVGAGAAVVSDIDDGDIVGGVPARSLK
jgi:sugar O-acyltransferase (sialic acid O-acetyltransferase NeuD family)